MRLATTPQDRTMWYDTLPNDKSWGALWNGYIICGCCRAIRRVENLCPVCGDEAPGGQQSVVHVVDGKEIVVANCCFMGAEGRYEDWVYLQLMEREWKRPVLESDHLPGFSPGDGPSLRASIVVLFWSYFETRIERLLRGGLAEIPGRILEDVLRRYSSIGARMNDFYRIAFGSTYKEDLEAVGYGQVWAHLSKVQERRNLFAHGQPQAIDDHLVQSTVEMVNLEHEAWIAVFNKRAA